MVSTYSFGMDHDWTGCISLEKCFFLMENYLQTINFSNVLEFRSLQKSKKSLRVYEIAWRYYNDWVMENGYDPYNPPKSSYELLLCLFISSVAKERKLKDASISTYIAGIRHFYEEKGINLDTSHREIRRIRKGIKRHLGTHQIQKMPLTTESICNIIDNLNSKHITGIRDKALILLGFTGAFRRSELVSIDIEHISFTQEGMTIFMPFSKTDQEKKGRYIDIPFSKKESYCPIRSLKNWISDSGILTGPIFRRIYKSGTIGNKRLTDKSVALILKKHCETFGFADQISGHSLRSGHVTSAIKNGTPETWIMRQTGHTNINTLRKYERMQREFKANSAANLGI